MQRTTDDGGPDLSGASVCVAWCVCARCSACSHPGITTACRGACVRATTITTVRRASVALSLCVGGLALPLPVPVRGVVGVRLPACLPAQPACASVVFQQSPRKRREGAAARRKKLIEYRQQQQRSASASASGILASVGVAWADVGVVPWSAQDCTVQYCVVYRVLYRYCAVTVHVFGPRCNSAAVCRHADCPSLHQHSPPHPTPQTLPLLPSAPHWGEAGRCGRT